MAIGSLTASGGTPAGLSGVLGGVFGQAPLTSRQFARQRQAQTGTDTAGTAATNPATAVSSRQTISVAAASTAAAATVLTASQTAAVNQLKAQQAAAQLAVQAQLQAAGGYSSGVTYQYARGPDGTTYVVGGSVSFDTQSIPGNPNATIAKMETVRRAALSSPQLSAAALQALASADVAIAQADAALRSGQSTGSALGAYAAAAGLASPANHNTHQVALAV